MQKHVNIVDLVKSFPSNIFLQNLASIQKRKSPVKFAHFAEKSGKGSISNLSTKVPRDANLIPYIDREPESMLQVFRYIENPENLPENEEELDVLKADLEFYGFDTSNMGRPPKPASVPSSESVIRALLMTGGEGLLYGPKDVFPAQRQYCKVR